MNLKQCKLYGLQSKKELAFFLGIKSKNFLKSFNFKGFIYPYIDKTNKPRLVEAPIEELKNIQRRLLKYLQQIEFPDYVFSGIKGKGYVDNGKYHEGKNYFYKVDLSAFYPNISRDKVYRFFKFKLNMSSDVAKILTNVCTIDYEIFTTHRNYNEIVEFMKEKHIKEYAHLTTGSPVSAILSYLVNIDMFEKIYEYCANIRIKMSIYIDDIGFSSNLPITSSTIKFIKNTINKFGYNLSEQKCKYYSPNNPKKITGIIINKEGKLATPNKLNNKIYNKIEIYKIDNQNTENLASLKGSVLASNMIDGKFESLKKALFIKHSAKKRNLKR